MATLPITYTLECRPEDDGPEGHFASGSDADDAETLRWIREQLDSGNDWAWCCVRVVATVDFDGEAFQGNTFLGGCSYLSEDDFKEGCYYADLCEEAREDLLRTLDHAVKVGDLVASARKQVAP